jgi:glucan 1,3-beta-glucosidase
MSDVTFYGGAVGIQCKCRARSLYPWQTLIVTIGGNQQFTVRNFYFVNCKVAIDMLWDWGWTWKSLIIVGSDFGFRITGQKDIGGSIYLLDSVIADTVAAIFINSPKGTTEQQQWGVTIDNLLVMSVTATVLDYTSLTLLEGGTRIIESWTLGRYYDETSPDGTFTTGTTLSKNHPTTGSLMGGPNGGYFERSKPQYEDLDVSQFLSVKLLVEGMLIFAKYQKLNTI